MNQARSEDPPTYGADDALIERALAVLRQKHAPGTYIDSPKALKTFLTLAYSGSEAEVFSVVFLTSQHTIIEHVEMFTGTLAQTSVYPREVVKAALRLNAGAVIFCHNHPSGNAEPSRADENLTRALKAALGLIGVLTLDHVVVGGGHCVSFAERGLL